MAKRSLLPASKKGRFELYTIRPDGSGERRLTTAGGNKEHPRWSPDGRFLIYSSDSGGKGIWSMRADGTAPRRISPPAWRQPTRSGASAGRVFFLCYICYSPTASLLIHPNRRRKESIMSRLLLTLVIAISLAMTFGCAMKSKKTPTAAPAPQQSTTTTTTPDDSLAGDQGQIREETIARDAANDDNDRTFNAAGETGPGRLASGPLFL